MARIVIKKYKMFEEIDLDLDKSAIIIGKQASGKSTLCRLIYFFKRSIHDAFGNLLEGITSTESLEEKIIAGFKRLFIETFGSLRQEHPDIYIAYHFSHETYFEIFRNPSGIIELNTSPDTLYQSLFKEVYQNFAEEPKLATWALTPLREFVETVFGKHIPAVYFPASRNLFVHYPDIFNSYFRTRDARKNLPQDMQMIFDFINHADEIRSNFVSTGGFQALIDESIEFSRLRPDNSSHNADLCQHIVQSSIQILNAHYRIGTHGERLVQNQNSNVGVSLDNASSGQQEIIRVIQDVFLTVLFDEQVFRVYEEPESHLFPTAQKEILELMAMMINVTESQVIITTHSPYLLTVLNNLLYAHKVGNSGNVNGAMVRDDVPHPSTWLSPDQIEVYWLDGGTLTPLINERGLIGETELDSVSDEIGDEFDTMVAIRREARQ